MSLYFEKYRPPLSSKDLKRARIFIKKCPFYLTEEDGYTPYIPRRPRKLRYHVSTKAFRKLLAWKLYRFFNSKHS